MSGLLVVLIALCLQALLSVMCNAHHTLLVSKQLQLTLEAPTHFSAKPVASRDSELLLKDETKISNVSALEG